MKPVIADLEKNIEKLQKNLNDTKKFQNKLELNKSDLLRYVKVAEQNMKYLKKKSTISVASEYGKVLKAHKIALKQLEYLEEQIDKMNKIIDRLSESLTEQKQLLSHMKDVSTSKVIEFKKRS